MSARANSSYSAESQELSTASTRSSSSEGSCVSSQEVQHQQREKGETSETKAMPLVGCPRCLMYVLVSEADPKCPKCKSTVLLEFITDQENKKKPDTQNSLMAKIQCIMWRMIQKIKKNNEHICLALFSFFNFSSLVQGMVLNFSCSCCYGYVTSMQIFSRKGAAVKSLSANHST